MEDATHVAVRSQLGSLIEWIKSLRIHYRLKILLRSLADYHGSNGRCFPSIGRLAGEIGVSRQTIHRWMNQLETSGLIERVSRYREDGGRTSNFYRLMLQGTVTPVRQQEDSRRNHVVHADKQDVSRREPVKPAADTQSAARAYKIAPESMGKIATSVQHYKIAVQRRWISSGERDRLSYFSSWIKIVRQYKAGKLRNPAAMLVHVLKSGILHQYPAEQDEIRAIQTLRTLRQQGERLCF